MNEGQALLIIELSRPIDIDLWGPALFFVCTRAAPITGVPYGSRHIRKSY